MNSAFESLILTPTTSLFIGACFTVGVISAGLAYGFYTIYRSRSLFDYSIVAFSTFGLLALGNADPQNIHDLEHHWLIARSIHLGSAIAIYFFYRLVCDTFSPLPSSRLFPASTFKLLADVTISVRLLAVIFFSETLVYISALLTALLLTIVFGYAIACQFRSRSIQVTRSNVLMQMACALFTLVAVYPLARVGLIPAALKPDVPFIVLTALTLASSVWLVRLVEKARELKEAAELRELKNLARTLIQLRDLMNTPLQIIEFSVSTLQSGHFENGNQAAILAKMTAAIDRLREINRAIAKYEKNVDWEQTTNFAQTPGDDTPSSLNL